jgi:hypothetical protein
MDIITYSLTATDLEVAQQALRDIHAILHAITPGMDRGDLFYEIGRAQGTAWLGLNHSGAKNLPSLVKEVK